MKHIALFAPGKTWSEHIVYVEVDHDNRFWANDCVRPNFGLLDKLVAVTSAWEHPLKVSQWSPKDFVSLHAPQKFSEYQQQGQAYLEMFYVGDQKR
jgi:hypothetical protein